jgi:hypothetical protein
MTMKGTPSRVRPTSMIRTPCSLWILAAARASRKNRWSISPSSTSPSITLMATRWVRSRWCAASTSPMPPRPMTSSMRYLSATRAPGTNRASERFGVVMPLTLSAPARPVQSELAVAPCLCATLAR